jgi:hypothetical protein
MRRRLVGGSGEGLVVVTFTDAHRDVCSDSLQKRGSRTLSAFRDREDDSRTGLLGPSVSWTSSVSGMLRQVVAIGTVTVAKPTYGDLSGDGGSRLLIGGPFHRSA